MQNTRYHLGYVCPSFYVALLTNPIEPYEPHKKRWMPSRVAGLLPEGPLLQGLIWHFVPFSWSNLYESSSSSLVMADLHFCIVDGIHRYLPTGLRG